MEKYSADYFKTGSNFVIRNLNENINVNSGVYPAVCVLKNILMRGKPSAMSDYLREQSEFADMTGSCVLIDREVPDWSHTIRGYEKENDYPAAAFFYDIIPKYLEEYRYIQQLILPEANFNEIIQEEKEKFISQRVDFYLPQAALVIEIDGAQHKLDESERYRDEERDEELKRYGIEVIRINAADIKTESKNLLYSIKEIKDILNRDSTGRLEAYKKFYFQENIYDEYNVQLTATAVMRFQILLLSLLEREIIRLDEEEWTFNILERDITGFAEIAIEDLFMWLEAIMGLQKRTKFMKPHIIIYEHDEENFKYRNNALNIEFQY